MKFRFDDYTFQSHVMLCETKEEIDLFSEILEKDGRKWYSGKKYTAHKELTPCGFFFNNGTYSRDIDYISDHRMILFSDFEWGDARDEADTVFDEAVYMDGLGCENIRDMISYLLGYDRGET